MNEEMPPPTLLRSAGRLIEMALEKLDTSSRPCRECGLPNFADNDQARVFQQFANTSEKLYAAASRLENAARERSPRP